MEDLIRIHYDGKPVSKKKQEKVLGRPVYTHEFAQMEKLQLEYLGIRKQPILEEIIESIPKKKIILIRGE